MKQSLKTKFLLYIATLIICAMSLTTVVAYINSKDAIHKAITEQLSQLVISTTNHIAFWIHDRKQDMTNWSEQQLYQTSLEDSYLGRAARESASLRLKKERQNYTYYESLNLANAQGEIVCSTDEKSTGKMNIANQQFFQKSLEGNIFLSSVIKSPVTKRNVFILSVPVKKNDAIEGVFYGVIDVDIFSDLFISPVKIGTTGYAYLVGSDGATIAHSDKKNIFNVNIQSFDWGREMMKKDEGFITYVWEGVEKIVFFKKSKDIGWLVAAGAGTKEIFAPVQRLQWINVMITLIFIFIAIMSITVLYRRIILRPMSYLMDGIASFGRGELDKKIKLETDDEFGNLAGTFNRMAEDLKKTTVSRDALVKEIEERKRLEKIVLQSEKMAAVGQLAGGVAHEINNPLGVILGFAQSLVRRMQPGDPYAIPLQSIEREAMRCRDLVQDLLTFSRIGKTEMEKINLSMVIESSLSLVSAQARVKNVSLVRDFSPDLPKILANQNQIQQVVINLCNNAIDAMPQGGTLTIRTQRSRLREKDALEIQVQDTGSGIPKEIQSKIFEPFFTTKEVGKGTGLGLSLVFEIVQKHDGHITVQSESKKGTTFKIYLPVAPIQ